MRSSLTKNETLEGQKTPLKHGMASAAARSWLGVITSDDHRRIRGRNRALNSHGENCEQRNCNDEPCHLLGKLHLALLTGSDAIGLAGQDRVLLN
jgi:hypothetical protein